MDDNLEDVVFSAIQQQTDHINMTDGIRRKAAKAAIDAVYNWQIANGYIVKAPLPTDAH